jgi:hypothetical protein
MWIGRSVTSDVSTVAAFESSGIDASGSSGIKSGRGRTVSGSCYVIKGKQAAVHWDSHQVDGEFSRWYNVKHMRLSTPEC